MHCRSLEAGANHPHCTGHLGAVNRHRRSSACTRSRSGPATLPPQQFANTTARRMPGGRRAARTLAARTDLVPIATSGSAGGRRPGTGARRAIAQDLERMENGSDTSIGSPHAAPGQAIARRRRRRRAVDARYAVACAVLVLADRIPGSPRIPRGQRSPDEGTAGRTRRGAARACQEKAKSSTSASPAPAGSPGQGSGPESLYLHRCGRGPPIPRPPPKLRWGPDGSPLPGASALGGRDDGRTVSVEHGRAL